MAKSLRSKRKKRLRTLRREIVEPFYDKKDEAKFAAQEAALAAPPLPVHPHKTTTTTTSMETTTVNTSMDVEMADGGASHNQALKPVGSIGKKWKKKVKSGKRKHHGKGKIRRKRV